MVDSLPNTCPIVVFDRISPNGKQKTLVVEQRLVHMALLLLKEINPFYANIEIDENILMENADREEIELVDNIENLYDSCNFTKSNY